MEGPKIELHDWELLPTSQTPLPPTTQITESPQSAMGEADSDDGITPDYFALDPDRKRFDLDQQEVHSDSDRPSWVDPDELEGKAVLAGGELWTSDESSDEQRSPRELESSVLYGQGGSGLAVGCELGSAESCVEGGDVGSDHGDGGSGERSGVVWWRLPVELLKYCAVPVELLKYCAVKVRPVWSISLCAALFGIVVLGRKLYNMRKRSRNLSVKVGIDDKKASLFALRAARLNEAFSLVKRTPIIKPPLPHPGITPWPVLALR